MTNRFCKGCNQLTGWRHSMGILDWLLVLASAGMWITIWPLHRKRCVKCGQTSQFGAIWSGWGRQVG